MAGGAGPSVALGSGLPVLRLPEFFRSQRQIILDTEKLGRSAQDVAEELLDGTPRIRLGAVEGDDTLVVNVHTLNEGEEHAIADCMRELLS